MYCWYISLLYVPITQLWNTDAWEPSDLTQGEKTGKKEETTGDMNCNNNNKKSIERKTRQKQQQQFLLQQYVIRSAKRPEGLLTVEAEEFRGQMITVLSCYVHMIQCYFISRYINWMRSTSIQARADSRGCTDLCHQSYEVWKYKQYKPLLMH